MEPTQERPKLSGREQQLITLAAQGLTDIAIARQLGISEPTVKSYWGRVRAKFGPYNRTELVAHALREESQRIVTELNGEIERLRSALRDSGESAMDLHREILEAAPDAVFAVSPDGLFVWLNLEAERMFGYRLDELVGMPVSALVPERLRERHMLHMSVYFANPERKQMGEHLTTTALRRNGEEFPIAASLTTIETPKGRLVTCFLRDLSSVRD